MEIFLPFKRFLHHGLAFNLHVLNDCVENEYLYFRVRGSRQVVRSKEFSYQTRSHSDLLASTGWISPGEESVISYCKRKTNNKPFTSVLMAPQEEAGMVTIFRSTAPPSW